MKWIAIITLFCCSIASACPLCRDSVSATTQPATAGFNGSIGWMLIGTFGILATLVWQMRKNVSKASPGK